MFNIQNNHKTGTWFQPEQVVGSQVGHVTMLFHGTAGSQGQAKPKKMLMYVREKLKKT